MTKQALYKDTDKKKKIKYIDSIRGLAATFIMLGHFYYGFFADPSIINENVQVFSFYTTSHNLFYFLFNGTFCVSVFCVLSGWFTKPAKTFKELLFNIFKRWLRLAIPLTILLICVFALSCFNLFRWGEEFSQMAGGTWILFKSNTFSLFDALFNGLIGVLFLGRSSFSSQLWMLRPLFFGQILLLLFFFFERIPKKTIRYILQCLIILFSFAWSYPCFAVSLGGVLKKAFEKRNFDSLMSKSGQIIVILAALLILIIGHKKVFLFLPTIEIVGHSLDIYERIQTLMAVMFVFCIFVSKNIQRVLNNSAVYIFGQASMAIYLIHVPIFMSVSPMLLMLFLQNSSYAISYLFTEIISISIVILLSAIWHFSVDKVTTLATKTIDKKISPLLNRNFLSKKEKDC